jgi:methyl-accepting chemotaxis protein
MYNAPPPRFHWHRILARLRIGPRLALSHALLILMMLIVGGYGAYSVRGLAGELARTADVSLVKVENVERIVQDVQTIAAATRDLLLLDESRQIKKQRELIETARAGIREAGQRLSALTADAAEGKTLAHAQAAQTAFLAAVDKFLRTADAGNPDEARAALVVDVRPAQKAYQSQLKALSQAQFDLARQLAREGEQTARRAQAVAMALVAVALVAGGLAALLIARSILQPVNAARETALAIAAGDLEHRVAIGGHDEVAEMLGAIGRMQQQLCTVISQVDAAAHGVAGNARQLLASNEQLSDRTSRAGAHLQQTASSIEQISSTLQTSRDVALRAADLAREARTAASAGGESVQSVIVTMQQIAEWSMKIRDIIGVIDGISFQTNILALNAAVEAARAGEHGKGFAVVAAEVRALASRSAQAAREVRELIERSNEQVQDGNARVSEAGERIGGVVERVHRMGELIEQISHGAREQAAGVGVVNGAMCELDRSTQQNATLVDDLAQSARHLGDGASQLLSSVGYFRRRGEAANA